MSNMGSSLLMSGQRVMDIHTDPDHDAGVGTGADEQQEDRKGNPNPKSYKFKYTTLQGYFLQDDPRTKAAGFDFTTTNFGLIQRPYDSDDTLPNHGADMTNWQRFEHHISSLNRAAEEEAKKFRPRHGDDEPEELTATTSYRLLFLARHGNGYHNIAERYYGNVAWDCHFSALDGDPEAIMTWADAHLSREGIRQARDVNGFWKRQLADEKMSLPQSWYVSPLDRAMQTAEFTFEGIVDKGFRPVVMERLREVSGIHTCDRRSSVSSVRERYPTYDFEFDPLLTEDDEFWDADRRESKPALTLRLQRLLDRLMETDKSERISMTSHSGAIGAILRVLGHRQFSLGTGAVIPVFVQVERIPLDEDEDKAKETKRHGGSAEGGKHTEPDLHLDLDNDEGKEEEQDPDDRSKWKTIPSCPADMDLFHVGQQRWNMGLKEYLDGVENGTVTVEEVAFRSTG